jgi:hypothetical protein
MSKNILQQLLLAAVSLLVAAGIFFALEFSLRAFAPQPPRGFSDNLFEKRDGLTFLIPGTRGTQYGREFNVSIEGNSHGYRTGTWGCNTNIDSTLWLFGDSFPFGWGVEADRSISTLINNSGTRCVNFGIPGDFFTVYTRRLEQAIASGQHPSAILLLVYDNDFHLERNARWSSSQAPAPVIMRMNVVPELGSRELLLKSHLVRLAGRGMDKLGLSSRLAAVTGYDKARLNLLQTFLPIHRRSYFESSQFDQSRDDFREFIAKALSVTPRVEIIRIQPLFITGEENRLNSIKIIQDNPQEYDFQKLDQELGRLCTASGAGYHVFRIEGNLDPLDFFFRYDMHLNADGHSLLTQFSLDILGNN